MTTAAKPHSAEYFGEYRDFWWNRDFLELMARRLGFDRIHSVLDVGCGMGHWGQILAWVLPRDAQLTGIDREAEWIEKAAARAARQGLGNRYHYTIGDANRIPFPEAAFDMVTCQTVLIHLGDPEGALREMLRVLKPGGLLLAVEPNNLVNEAIMNSISAHAPVDELADRYRFALTCQRGKWKAGQGFLSIGDLLPGMIAKLNGSDIQVYLSDKASPIFPPYNNRDQQALIQQLIDWSKQGYYIGDKAETRRFFLAGGGSDPDFERLWDLILKEGRELPKHAGDGAYHTGGGGVHYLVSARKPAHQDSTRAVTTQEIQAKEARRQLSNSILRSLPRWFGIEKAIVDYVNAVERLPTFSASIQGQTAGFISIEFHNPFTAEIHVMAVRERFHRHGAGRALIAAAEAHSRKHGAEFLMVKTLGPSRESGEYDQTRRFYLSMGFRPLEELKTIWDESNPCLIMVKKL